MKKKWIWITPAVFILLLSVACTIAGTNDLPEDPSDSIIVEILDQSRTAGSGYYDAVSYYNVILSDPEWLDFLYADVEFTYPDGDTGDIEFSYAEDSAGNIMITGIKGFSSIPQGDYAFEIDAGDDSSGLHESFPYEFNIDIDGSTSDLSVRDTAYYTPSEPFVCDADSSYTMAISDDGTTVYITADNPSGFDLVSISSYTNDVFTWGFLIQASVLQSGKWTAIPVSQITFASGNTYSDMSPDVFRSTSSSYNKYAYTSTIDDKSWGTLYRSETSEPVTVSTVPDSEDIIQLPSRSASVLSVEPMPLYEQFIKGDLGAK